MTKKERRYDVGRKAALEVREACSAPQQMAKSKHCSVPSTPFFESRDSKRRPPDDQPLTKQRLTVPPSHRRMGPAPPRLQRSKSNLRKSTMVDCLDFFSHLLHEGDELRLVRLIRRRMTTKERMFQCRRRVHCFRSEV